MTALWILWFLACLLLAYGLIRAARDYRDDEPAPGPQWAHDEPGDPDRQPGTDGRLLAACNRLYALPDHDPNHSTKGDQ